MQLLSTDCFLEPLVLIISIHNDIVKFQNISWNQKNPKLALRAWFRKDRLRHDVPRRDRVGKAAGHWRNYTNVGHSVGAASRARRNYASCIQLDVGREVTGKGDGVAGLFVLFQRELVARRVNLTHVVDAGI